jgi:hypothetical protein
MSWCPMCGTQYTEGWYCPNCESGLVSRLRPWRWYAQLPMVAVLAVVMTCIGILGIGLIGALFGINSGVHSFRNLIASLIDVTVCTAIAFGIGRIEGYRLTAIPTVLGWLIGVGALSWFLLPWALPVHEADAFTVISFVMLLVQIPATGAVTMLCGARFKGRDTIKLAIAPVLLALAGTVLLYYWTILPCPPWAD